MKMIKKSKKGILFTITTIFLLSAVFMLSKTYFEYNKDSRNTVTFSSFGDKLNFVEDDIVSNIYSDLLWLNISSITRQNNEVIINFLKAGKLSPNINHNNLFQNYETFIEGTYATLQNLNITFNNFNPTFNINPYNTRFVYDSQELSIYNDRDYLKKILIKIKANATNLVSNTTPSTDGHDYPEINVIVLNKNNVIVYDANPQQDPDEMGIFEIVFEDGKQVTVSFGVIGESPSGTLIVDNNFYTEITQLELRYDEIDDKLLFESDANLSITSQLEDITKATEIILLEE